MPDNQPIQKTIRKVEPVRIFEQAVDQIRNLILTGELSVGEKLPTEMELSKLLNVGRSSVREALRVLEAEGLVEVRRGSGTYITSNRPANNRSIDLRQWLKLREESLEQVLEVRESIEGLSAGLAAMRATPDQVQDILEIAQTISEKLKHIDENEANQAAFFDELSRLDVAFHLQISQASGNDIANEIINHIIPAFQESNRAVLYLYRKALLMESEHQQIAQAIQARDHSAAETAMRHHIQRVRHDILQVTKKD
ncbi:MAG TPA: FadR/GntR family transcriptional regulator [Anaerolineales bacterium]|nr:FadR/GntR family transcriptional regulator [Anaerolineales bacterium]